MADQRPAAEHDHDVHQHHEHHQPTQHQQTSELFTAGTPLPPHPHLCSLRPPPPGREGHRTPKGVDDRTIARRSRAGDAQVPCAQPDRIERPKSPYWIHAARSEQANQQTLQGRNHMSAITSITGSTTAPTTAAARAEGVSKYYGTGDATVAALKDVDVALEGGHFTAIMGPSGSGKSTLLHLLAGLDRPSSGEVYLGDTQLTALGD